VVRALRGVDSEPRATLILGSELLQGEGFASQLLPPAGQYSLLHGITIYLLLIIPLPADN
jgi:hypothetical protein